MNACPAPPPGALRGGDSYPALIEVDKTEAWSLIRSLFPEEDMSVPDKRNLILFGNAIGNASSGSLDETIEEMLNGDDEQMRDSRVAFLILQPRLLRFHYGELPIPSQDAMSDELDYLRRLRDRSLMIFATDYKD